VKNNLKRLATGPEPAPKAESERLRERAQAAEVAGAAADADARRAEAALRAVIVSGDEAEVERAERQLDAALKACRRHRIAAEELADAADRAQVAEREKAALDEADAADREAEQVASELKRLYPELVGKLVDLLAKVQNSENRCREAETLLIAIGKHRHIAGPQERSFPGPAGLFVPEQIVAGLKLPMLLGASGETLDVPCWPTDGGITMPPPPPSAAPEPRPHPGGRGPWG